MKHAWHYPLWALLLAAALATALAKAIPVGRCCQSTRSAILRRFLTGSHTGKEVWADLTGAGGKFVNMDVGFGSSFVLCLRGGGARNKWRRKMNKNGGGGGPWIQRIARTEWRKAGIARACRWISP